LIVEGYVEASMDSRVIEIAETSVYKGTVEIDTAIIKGKFEGELTVRERIIIHATGDVSGKIRYGRLAIEEGGRVHGHLDELHLRPGVKQPAIAEAKDTKTSEAAE
jgi:cytoskeletal protein CcmA (bactofilin family)